MRLAVNISIPQIWGEGVFRRNEWGDINFLVGPNGSGKG